MSESDESEVGGIVGWISLLVLTAIVSSFGGAVWGWSYHKEHAVKAGHAEYYLDANNDRQWRWLPARRND